MKYCPRCGTSVSESTTYCPGCGLKFGKGKAEPVSSKKQVQQVKKETPKNDKKRTGKKSGAFSGAVDFAEIYDFSSEDYSREELEALSADKTTPQRREIMKATAQSISSGTYTGTILFFAFNLVLGILAALAVDTERFYNFVMSLIDQFSARATETMGGFVSFLSNPFVLAIIVFVIKIPILLICIGMFNFARSCAELKSNPRAAERPLKGAGVLRKINKFWLAFALVILVLVEGLMIYGILWLFSFPSGADAFSITVLIVSIAIMTLIDALVIAFFLKFENTVDVTELNMRKGNARYLPSKYVSMGAIVIGIANLAFAVIKIGKLHSYIGVLSTLCLSAAFIFLAVTVLSYRKKLIEIEKNYREKAYLAAEKRRRKRS